MFAYVSSHCERDELRTYKSELAIAPP